MPGQQLGSGLDLAGGHLPDQKGVHLPRDLRGRVAKDHLDHLDRNTAGKRQRAGAMTSVVQPDHRKPTRLHMRLKRVRDATGAERSAVRQTEDQIVSAVVRAEQIPVLHLRQPMTRECRLSRTGQWHPAATHLRLGPLKEPPDMVPTAVGTNALSVGEPLSVKVELDTQ
jgi:hypothetical protein